MITNIKFAALSPNRNAIGSIFYCLVLFLSIFVIGSAATADRLAGRCPCPVCPEATARCPVCPEATAKCRKCPESAVCAEKSDETGIDSVASMIRNLSASVDMIYRLVNQKNSACSSCCHESGRQLFEVDLSSGQSNITPESGISWSKVITDPNSQIDCDMQGVLKIIFPAADNHKQTRKLQFDLYFSSNRSGFLFDIGDSTVNGYGGDAGHSSNAAEVHSINEGLYVYSNILPGYTSYVTNHLLVESTANALSDHVTVIIGDEYVKFDNNRGLQKTYQSQYLFTLRGQPTLYGPVDYVIYFSMNRVIYPFSFASRTGSGLCRAVIKALDSQ